MSDPISEIESAKGNHDLGATVAQFYSGALADTGSRVRAFWVTAAWCYALVKSNQEPDDEG
jgi:hypothetical protein